MMANPRPESWSAKHGSYPSGDPDLQHYIGELLYKGTAFYGSFLDETLS